MVVILATSKTKEAWICLILIILIILKLIVAVVECRTPGHIK